MLITIMLFPRLFGVIKIWFSLIAQKQQKPSRQNKNNISTHQSADQCSSGRETSKFLLLITNWGTLTTRKWPERNTKVATVCTSTTQRESGNTTRKWRHKQHNTTAIQYSNFVQPFFKYKHILVLSSSLHHSQIYFILFI